MKNLLELIIKQLVDFPDDVNINEIAGEQTCVYELRVNKEDLGKIIGKQGRTARAIRTLLSAAAVKDSKRVMLEIID
ncbi:MAG: KH domain-containing protein [Bdellovibrionota bacterium]|nr:KH domain-containing protein [Deltaproteobacteria bacterium]